MRIQEFITALPIVLMAAPICGVALFIAPVILDRPWRTAKSKSGDRARIYGRSTNERDSQR